MKICLFGAASDAVDPAYLTAAEEFGASLARRGHELVFGGGATGLMGAAARGVRRAGGRLTGVAPRFFDREGVLYQDCTEFIFTDTMRERKQIMEERSDAAVMAPGGIGTLEEFFEILTLRQLGQYHKPIAILNLQGYFDGLQILLETAVERCFLEPEGLRLYGMFSDGEALLDALEQEKI